MEKKNQEKIVTRAEKRDATKNLIKEVLKKANAKPGELIDGASKIYTERFPGEETENVNDVKGRIGSVIDVMKKEGEIFFDEGVYALKVKEKPVKTARKASKKTEEGIEKKPKKRVGAKAKKEEEQEEVVPLPTAPIQPIVPVVPVTPETAPEPMPKKTRTGKAVKSKEPEKGKPEETRAETVEKQAKDEKPEESKNPLMDVSFLLGDVNKPHKTEENNQGEAIDKGETKKTEKLNSTAKPLVQKRVRSTATVKRVIKALTPDEKLKDAFLARLRKLGGEYFEYYSIYLLEKYSRKNGRRLENLAISAGDHDGGIDGEIELTDKLGFRETIYIQAKNWDPSKGDEKLWVVGETLLQQFIGACVCRQAKEGKQHCRGIFITTSRFTPEAKKILEDTSDKFVGYDGGELYETAKECAFGIIKKNGEYVLDEGLLSGMRAFFNME